VLRIRNAAFQIWRLVRPHRRWCTGASWEGARWARTPLALTERRPVA
jgi:hypothetical protein